MVPSLPPAMTIHVTLGKSAPLSALVSSSVQGDYSSFFLKELLGELNEMMSLVHGSHSIMFPLLLMMWEEEMQMSEPFCSPRMTSGIL